MNLNEWLNKNRSNFGSNYEVLFAESVLPLVQNLRFDTISTQYPFHDTDNRQRYCDFIINENDEIRIAIEIDGYDKRGMGSGMSRDDFIDWQRRQAALTSQGWYVLRFANRDVRDAPQRCAEHISLLLKRLRCRSQNNELSSKEMERLNTLSETQNHAINYLKEETSVMKYTIASFTALILVLVMVIVWQGEGFSTGQRNPTAQNVDQTVVTGTSSPSNNDGVRSVSSEKEMLEENKSRNPDQTAKQPSSGADCANPVSWKDARLHTGTVMAVAGPLMKTTNRGNVRGNPTWIDIGGVFPDPRRVTAIIWETNKSEFPAVHPGQMAGVNICVIGLVENYKGVIQIELKEASQLVVLE